MGRYGWHRVMTVAVVAALALGGATGSCVFTDRLLRQYRSEASLANGANMSRRRQAQTISATDRFPQS